MEVPTGMCWQSVSIEPGSGLTYYWGAAWSKADIKDSAAWNAYMADFAQKVRNPLTVTVK